MAEIEIKTDSIGDTFVTGYNRYLNEATDPTAQSHLKQLIRNYESAFREPPSPEQLDAALKFVWTFFAEIGELYPKTHYAKAASDLNWMIGDNAVETAENIAQLSNL